MGSPLKRIGILTGGGDCPGLNAAIRAVVKSAIGIHRLEVYGIENGFDGLIKKQARPLALDDVRGILTRGGTILGATRRHNPFQYQEKTGTVDRSRTVLENAAELGLDALVVLGGDGTLTIANRFWEMGLPLVAIPKTIDNDLSGTDVAIGFNTAVVTAMEALDKLHTTAESHHRVMVVEVMGNKAGWIALESGIAGGADVILIPEIPFSIEKTCATVVGRNSLRRSFSMIVVSEGAREIGHEEVYADTNRRRLGGIAQAVAEDIEKRLELETRVLVLGHLQRGGSPNSFDRVLASRFGVHALRLITRGEFGKMVASRNGEVVSIPIQEAVARLNLVDPKCDLAFTAEALGISLGR